MRDAVRIEEIEEMRCQQGIDDGELREQIRGLVVGSLVKLTLLSGAEPFTGRVVLVRITSIRGWSLRGKVLRESGSTGDPRGTPGDLPGGALLSFTTAHIHPIPS